MAGTFLKREFWPRFRRNRLALSGLVLVAGLFLVSLLAPWLAPYDPNFIDIKAILVPPSSIHLMGTDSLGRDVFSRIIFGSQISLKVGFVAVGLATIIGVFLGAVAGYYGGWVDNLLMRAVDLMLCFPTFFLILAVIAVLEPSIWNIMVIIGLTSWMGVARLVRAEFLTLQGTGVCSGRPGPGGQGRPYYLPASSAQRPGPGHGLRHPGGSRRHSHRKRPELSGFGSPTPHPQLGQHPHRREGQHRDCLVAFRFPRPGNSDYRYGL